MLILGKYLSVVFFAIWQAEKQLSLIFGKCLKKVGITRTKKNLKISENEDLENYGEFLETGMDEFLRGVDMAGSIMIAVYVPAPSFFGSYYGFVN